MANSTANDWEILSPLDTEPRRDGAREVRLLREAVEIRIEKEHITPATDDSIENQGMEHKPGSAMAYFEDNDGEDIGPLLRPDGSTVLDDGTIDAGRLWVDTKDGSYQLYVYEDATGLWIPVKAVAKSGPLPDSYFNFEAVGQDTFSSPKITLTFLPRRVTIHKDDGSVGWGGTFLLPEGSAGFWETSVYLRILRGTVEGREFELKRTDDVADDGLVLELKYTGGTTTDFNGTWSAYAAGGL